MSALARASGTPSSTNIHTPCVGSGVGTSRSRGTYPAAAGPAAEDPQHDAGLQDPVAHSGGGVGAGVGHRAGACAGAGAGRHDAAAAAAAAARQHEQRQPRAGLAHHQRAEPAEGGPGGPAASGAAAAAAAGLVRGSAGRQSRTGPGQPPVRRLRKPALLRRHLSVTSRSWSVR